MAVLQLRFWPDEVLKRLADPVADFGPELKKTVEDMAETMYVENGIGLAAPQVGISHRIVVIDVPDEERNSRLRALINPTIIAREGTIVWEEGCLSFPGVTVEVERAERIRVRHQDVDGNWVELDAEGLEAVCVQHEIDHIDGVTFIRYLSPLKRKLVLRDLKKTLAEREEAA